MEKYLKNCTQLQYLILCTYISPLPYFIYIYTFVVLIKFCIHSSVDNNPEYELQKWIKQSSFWQYLHIVCVVYQSFKGLRLVGVSQREEQCEELRLWTNRHTEAWKGLTAPSFCNLSLQDTCMGWIHTLGWVDARHTVCGPSVWR